MTSQQKKKHKKREETKKTKRYKKKIKQKEQCQQDKLYGQKKTQSLRQSIHYKDFYFKFSRLLYHQNPPTFYIFQTNYTKSNQQELRINYDARL
eukprot:TRINITY_DN18100_c0_g1_i1.p2 TRINITY_DN18100_c0_g1~~TRINITY_DN18100_c0_g1_i1.p2  ORF type:complete len:102 (-),score=3.73 TRINITY_DN18100_c0_g1_i1:245-526(-)